jgi:hypothetical protein
VLLSLLAFFRTLSCPDHYHPPQLRPPPLSRVLSMTMAALARHGCATSDRSHPLRAKPLAVTAPASCPVVTVCTLVAATSPGSPRPLLGLPPPRVHAVWLLCPTSAQERPSRGYAMAIHCRLAALIALTDHSAPVHLCRRAATASAASARGRPTWGHARPSRGLPWGRTGLVLAARSSAAATGQPGRGSVEPEPLLLLLCSIEKQRVTKVNRILICVQVRNVRLM